MGKKDTNNLKKKRDIPNEESDGSDSDGENEVSLVKTF